jgi:hypothetical protein
MNEQDQKTQALAENAAALRQRLHKVAHSPAQSSGAQGTKGVQINTAPPTLVSSLDPLPRNPFTEPTDAEKNELLHQVAGRAKQRLIDKYSKPIIRDGKVIEILGSEWKLFKIAEVFDYDESVINIIENERNEILNNPNTVEILLSVETIRLLRKLTNETH